MGKFIVILLSLVYVVIVSALGALPSLIWGFKLYNYLAWVAILTAIQFAAGRLWNYFIDRRIDASVRQSAATEALANSIQYAELSCAYCGTRNVVRVLIDRENTFTCEACKEISSIQIGMSTARITQPIMPKAELASIFKGLDKKE